MHHHSRKRSPATPIPSHTIVTNKNSNSPLPNIGHKSIRVIRVRISKVFNSTSPKYSRPLDPCSRKCCHADVDMWVAEQYPYFSTCSCSRTCSCKKKTWTGMRIRACISLLLRLCLMDVVVAEMILVGDIECRSWCLGDKQRVVKIPGFELDGMQLCGIR